MTGRSYTSGNSSYSYGFNSHEKSDEISGQGNHTTALFGEYDTRLGRRWNLDPRPDVSMSPYSMFGNNPIWFNDIALDTPRNAGNGQLGQQFTFATAPGTNISADQLSKLSTRFLSSLTNTINNGGNTYGGNAVSLNVKDGQAPVIAVTFGNFGVSNSNGNSINMDIGELNSDGNTAAHEWLHTAGLMDRYYELYGRRGGDRESQIVESQRSGVVPMGALPPSHDPAHNSSTNIMSNSANTGITAMQWSIVFNFQTSGISEESLGTLGKVSFVYDYSTLNPNSPTNRQAMRSSLMRNVGNNTNRIAFSSTTAYHSMSRGPLLAVPNAAFFDISQANLQRYIIHNNSGNVLGSTLLLGLDWEQKQLNTTIRR